MKLHYFLNEKGEKIYTLKEKIEDNQIKEAHYKFIKIKSLKENLQAKNSE